MGSSDINDSHLLVVLVGAAFLLPALYFANRAWMRWRWEQLAGGLQMELSHRHRSKDMHQIPIVGEVDERPAVVITQANENGKPVTLVVVTIRDSLDLGLIGEAESWQTGADRAVGQVSRLTSATGLLGLGFEFVGANRDELQKVVADDPKLRKTYLFRARDAHRAERLINTPKVTSALLAARRPRWSVRVDDNTVTITPGLGVVTKLRTVRQAMGLAAQLGNALNEADVLASAPPVQSPVVVESALLQVERRTLSRIVGVVMFVAAASLVWLAVGD